MTSSDNDWRRVTTSGTTSDNKWERVTTNEKEWHNEWQWVVERVTTSGITSDNERLRVTANENDSLFSLIFLFFEQENNLTTQTFKNFKPWGEPIELRAETSS